MRFYDKEKELEVLKKIEKKSEQESQVTFVIGNRRTGKTSLVLKATEKTTCVYLFVSKKNEVMLCNEFTEEIRSKLNIEITESFKQIEEMFVFLLKLARSRHFTLIIDEFQEILSLNPLAYQNITDIWYKQKTGGKLNLILCCTHSSLTNQIFETPLIAGANKYISIKAFDTNTIKEILSDQFPSYTSKDLLAFYTVTGGVAKYVKHLVEAKAFTLESILDTVFSNDSFFLEEGKNILIDELGKDHGNYFSILSLIACGITSRVEMQSTLGIQIGGFLDRLESDFGLIKRVRPIFAEPTGRFLKYEINDNFLNFWFRYIYTHRSSIEMGSLDILKEIVLQDYKIYSDTMLTKYFTNKFVSEQNYSLVGTHWGRAKDNEIPIVLVEELEKKLTLIDVKRKNKNVDISELKEKAKLFVKQFKDYNISYKGLSIKDM